MARCLLIRSLDHDAFRARLVLARELAGLTPRELGTLIGASPITVGNLEQGVSRNPNADTVVALARTLGVSLDWLLLGRGRAPTRERVQAAAQRAMGRRHLRQAPARGTVEAPPLLGGQRRGVR
jgi:transcriptional regulator with XRE-family HTH domain